MYLFLSLYISLNILIFIYDIREFILVRTTLVTKKRTMQIMMIVLALREHLTMRVYMPVHVRMGWVLSAVVTVMRTVVMLKGMGRADMTGLRVRVEFVIWQQQGALIKDIHFLLVITAHAHCERQKNNEKEGAANCDVLDGDSVIDLPIGIGNDRIHDFKRRGSEADDVASVAVGWTHMEPIEA